MPSTLLILLLTFAGDWPQFRGPNASGVAEAFVEQAPVFDLGKDLAWKVPIAGLAHSSPIVSGDRVIVATAVGPQDDPQLRLGLYGAGDAADDMGPHRWELICLDARNGTRQWETTVYEGTPRAKRHIKATHCNATPATNGQVIVALMGSEGLFCTDMNGVMKWRVDLGDMDMGAYNAPTYEWGPASSPIIYENLAIVQVDTQAEDYVAAFDLSNGKEVWRTARDELPSWGTPTVYRGSRGVELVTNGANLLRGYDPKTGEQLWELGGSSPITAPTPIFVDDLIVVASGRRPNKPIFAIRPGARGDITLPDGETSSRYIAWHKVKVGSYMPTPIIVADKLFVLENNGVFAAYDLYSGEQYYKVRVAHGGSGFSASPVAAGEIIYLPGEDGELFAVRAGTEYQELGRTELGETQMATPAIAGNVLYARGRHHLFALGKR